MLQDTVACAEGCLVDPTLSVLPLHSLSCMVHLAQAWQSMSCRPAGALQQAGGSRAAVSCMR